MTSVVDYLILLLRDYPLDNEPRAYTSWYGKTLASVYELKHALRKPEVGEEVRTVEDVWMLAAQIAVDAAMTADAYEKVYERLVRLQKARA